ncbi:MAG TPA: ATP-binding protein, partial [Acidimicrobiales bacterium]|nr:ATP-binding protein [Acidimicrobiales bacterium]
PGTPVEVRLHGDDGGVLVEVADRGPGVPAEDRQRIFEPFHRADPSRTRTTGGVGLGLAIVAAIVRSHGGEVGVRTNEHGGATFWVHLPVGARGAPPTFSPSADVPAGDIPAGDIAPGDVPAANGQPVAIDASPPEPPPVAGRAASPAGMPEPGTQELPWHAP